jgi:GrpB-like predicted nucleotidyltransferase (UPF0157 family)
MDNMTIEIAPYDSTWPDLFQQMALPIRAALGAAALRIDHIGSTAIPGAAAKPILDVQISVQAFEPFEPIRKPLTAVGYRWRADNADLTKRYFREAAGERRTHIHVRVAGSWSEQFALLFRDYMRCHPDDVQHYAALKYVLSARYRDDRRSYTDAKSPFIWQMMAKADAWAQATGWRAGAADI